MSNGIFNVLDFGADPTGAANSTAAFTAALAQAAVAGGIVEVPAGIFVVDQISIAPANGIWLRGYGTGATTLLSTVDGASPAILFATGVNAGKRNLLTDFFLQRKNFTGSGPSPSVAGNYGIAAIGGAGFQTVLRSVEVRGFGDAGIFTSGPTGPVTIESCIVTFCGDYAVKLTPPASANASIVGGAYQFCRGGIFYDGDSGGQSLLLVGPDVEVGDDATHPALRIVNCGGGATVIGGSYSLGSTGGPLFNVDSLNTVVAIESSRGVNISGILVEGNNGSGCYGIDGGGDSAIVGGNPMVAVAGAGKFAVHTNSPQRVSYVSPNALQVGFPPGNAHIDDPNWDSSGNVAINVAVGTAPIQSTFTRLVATTGLAVGNSASATTLGLLRKKIEVFDANGASLGFIPVYDTIG